MARAIALVTMAVAFESDWCAGNASSAIDVARWECIRAARILLGPAELLRSWLLKKAPRAIGRRCAVCRCAMAVLGEARDACVKRGCAARGGGANWSDVDGGRPSCGVARGAAHRWSAGHDVVRWEVWVC